MADSVAVISLAQARRAWRARQRLSHPPITLPSSEIPALLAVIGWIPVVAGDPGVYIALRARGALARRADLDAALRASTTLTIAPGPQGHAWLVPTADAPLARAFALADHASREARIAAACDLTEHELRAARDALRDALGTPVTPDDLRAKLSPAVQRPLGKVGKRAGCPTLATLALRALWIHGELLRVATDATANGLTYRYVLDPQPRAVPSPTAAIAAVVRPWFGAHAPATAKDFAVAYGLAGSRAHAAVQPLGLHTVTIDGLGDGYLTLPEDPGINTDEVTEQTVDLLPGHDPWLHAHPRLHGLCAPDVAAHAQTREHVPLASVLLDGTIVGVWTRHEGTGRISWRALVPDLSPEASQAIDAAVSSLDAFITQDFPLVPTPAQRTRTPATAARDFDVMG